MVTFVIGGMTGVLLAVPPADFVLHNSLFLVAHFHNVIIGGVLFGAFAGYTFWFPKAFGFRLHEGLGKAAFWFWIVGFYVAFAPALRAGPDGHDAPHAALRRRGLAPRLAGRGRRSGAHPDRHLPAGVAALRQHPRPRGAARHHRATLGMAVRWNGPRRRRRRRSISPCCPDVAGEDAYWHIKQRAIETTQLRARAPSTSTSTCRGAAPPVSSALSSRPSWALP